MGTTLQLPRRLGKGRRAHRARCWPLVLLLLGVVGLTGVTAQPSNGFDFPVGAPDAAGYYDAQPFGTNNHLGSDWNGNRLGNTDEGDAVYAASNGVVRYSGFYSVAWGNIITITHELPNGEYGGSVVTQYAHLQTRSVSQGDIVTRGQQIGTLGRTGTSSGNVAHLHFELRSDITLAAGGPGYSSNTTGYLNPTTFINAHRTLAGYSLRQTSSLAPSPSPLVTGQRVTTTVSLTNSGTQAYNGDFAVALHNSAGAFLGDLGPIKTNQTLGVNASRTLVFETTGNISSGAGQYQLQFKYRPTGSGAWILMPPGNFANPANVSIVSSPSTATLASIDISGGASSWNESSYRDFTATAYYSDGTSETVTTSATWSVNSGPIVMDSSLRGRIHAQAVSATENATFTVSFTRSGITRTATRTVGILNVASSLTGLTVGGGASAWSEDDFRDFTATATYSDGSSRTVTTLGGTTWTATSGPIAMDSSLKGRIHSQSVGADQSAAFTVSYTEGGITRSASRTVTIQNVAGYLNGLDVSKHNANLNWNAAYAAGYRFAYVRATDGYAWEDTFDPRFDSHRTGAEAAGLVVGFYHYAEVDQNPSLAGARAEAANFYNVVRPYLTSGRLRPAVDIEEGASLGRTGLTTWILEWITEFVRLSGVQPVVYTGQSFENSYLDSRLTGYPLWCARYSSSPPSLQTWPGWTLWQHTSSGNIPNFGDPDVDLNRFNGSLAQLIAALGIPASSATLSGVAISGGASSWNENEFKDFTATATFSDGSTANVTNNATWSVTSGPIVMDSSIRGRVHSQSVTGSQTAAFTASWTTGGITRTASRTVTVTDVPATLTSVTVSGGASSWTESSYRDFVATANFSDGSARDVTSSATWSVNSGPILMDSTLRGRVHAVAVTGDASASFSVSFTSAAVTRSTTRTVTILDAPAQTYVVTPGSGSNGSISPSVAQTVANGGSVTFSANPSPGYVVDAWWLNGVVVQYGVSSFTVNNVTANRSVTVTFKPAPVQTYTVTPASGSNGSISPGTTQTVASGVSVTFSANPSAGYVVDAWSLNGSVVQYGVSSFTVSNVTSNRSVTVTFKAAPAQTYTVTPGSGANGSISPSAAQTVASGGSVTFSANPYAGQVVDTWYLDGNTVQYGNTLFTVSNVTAHRSVHVTFKSAPVQTYSVTPGSGGGGSISPGAAQTVSRGGSVSFTASPYAGQVVDTWYLDGNVVQSGGAVFTVSNVTAGRSVYVTFKSAPVQTYTVTSSSGSNGSISPGGTQTVASGTGVTFSATPYTGQVVDLWYMNGNPAQTGGALFTLGSVTSDWNVYVTFKPAPVQTYAVTPGSGSNGSISPGTVQTVASGAGVTFSASAYTGFVVDKWFVDGAVAQTGGEVLTLSNVTASQSVYVTFRADGVASVLPHAYVRAAVGAPWGGQVPSGAEGSNEAAMNAVFGADQWEDLRFESVNATALFSAQRRVVFLEGSDSGASELEAFLQTHRVLLESWVSDGGRLFINAAPNEDNGLACGFGVSLVYNFPGTAANTVSAVRPDHPVFLGPQPVSGPFSGSFISHGTLSGAGLTPLLTGTGSDTGKVVLAEMTYGSGIVIFGGMTLSYFHSPQPQANHLRTNLLAYLRDHAADSDDVHQVAALATGWYSTSGMHIAANDNYITGRQEGVSDYRSFFIFELPELRAGETVLSAELLIYNPPGGYISPEAQETLQIREVSTAPGLLREETTTATDIFADLGEGTVFGETSVSPSSNGQYVTVSLDAGFLAHIAGKSGQTIAVGGSLSTLGHVGPGEYVFGSSSGVQAPQLRLRTSQVPVDYLVAVYDHTTDVPLTTEGYVATGRSVTFTLNHAPVTGAQLMVVENTALDFISGQFDNLSQGQAVALVHDGITYHFVANYYGGTGNDLVLAWATSNVYAWGLNGLRQLGTGSADPKVSLPYPAQTNQALSNTVVGLAAGASHSLALRVDGSIAAWGRKDLGQLGTNDFDYSQGYHSPLPVAVNQEQGISALYNKRVVAIAAGQDHSLALCSDGTVTAWGWNYYGQLGDATTQNRHVPVAAGGVLSGRRVVAIAAGSYHSLALCADGTLAAWGNNDFGQLGDGTTTQRPLPVTVTKAATVLQGRKVIAISAGCYHSMALCSDGTVATWGRSGVGTLGDGSTLVSRLVPGPIQQTGALAGRTVKAIAAGNFHNVVLCADGTVATWGENVSWQLGSRTSESDYSNVAGPVPVMVNATAGLSALAGRVVTSIAAGEDHCLARCSDGTLVTWGEGSRGQLGYGLGGFFSSGFPVAVTDFTFYSGMRFAYGGGGQSANHSLAVVASEPELPSIFVSREANGLQNGNTFNLGGVHIGVPGYVYTLDIYNGSQLPLTGLSASMAPEGNAGDFTVMGPDVTELGPGGHCTMTFFVIAQGLGARNGVLQIFSNDPNDSPFRILLSAYGTAPPGSIAFDVPPGTVIDVTEEAGVVELRVVRRGGTAGNISADISTSDGTAIAPGDYTAVNTVVPLADGVTQATFSIPIHNPPGTAGEGNETFKVDLYGDVDTEGTSSVTVRIIDSVDSTAPSPSVISNPAANAILGLSTSLPFTVVGSAADEKGLASVKVKLNDGDFVDAALSSPGAASSHWSAALVPVTGQNTIKVQSFDARGNPSTLVSRTFTVIRPLVVGVSGAGSVSPGYLGSSFRADGQSLTITATPSASAVPGSLFTGWTLGGQDVAKGGAAFGPARLGIASSSLEKPVLTFIFREGLVLTANFAPNPYAPLAGSYSGLIRASATEPYRPAPQAPGTPRSNSTEGLFAATVQNTGAFSAKLHIDGSVLNLAGTFDSEGHARFGTSRVKTLAVARTGKPSLSVAFRVNLHPARTRDTITGSVIATDFRRSVVTSVSNVEADRAFYNGVTESVPLDYLGTGSASGFFTMVLPALPPSDRGGPEGSQIPGFTVKDYPQGHGIGTITVTKSGLVTVTGRLADGTPLTASSSLAKDLSFPAFASLYGKLGFLSGIVVLDHQHPASDISGNGLQWLRPFQGTSHYYPHGWPEVIQVNLMAAKYGISPSQSVLKAANGANIQTADADGNTALSFSDGQLTESLNKFANLSFTDVVTKVPENDPTFTMAVNRTTGMITGSFDHTDDSKPDFSAIIYQKGPNAGAYGYFLTKQPVPIDYTGESGEVTIVAQ